MTVSQPVQPLILDPENILRIDHNLSDRTRMLPKHFSLEVMWPHWTRIFLIHKIMSPGEYCTVIQDVVHKRYWNDFYSFFLELTRSFNEEDRKKLFESIKLQIQKWRDWMAEYKVKLEGMDLAFFAMIEEVSHRVERELCGENISIDCRASFIQ